MWDFQNIGIATQQVESVNSTIRSEINKRFAGASHRLFKAFASLDQSSATDSLQNLGWRVWEDDEDLDEEIVAQAKSDCGHDPEDTVLVLITQDGDYLDLIRELRRDGVEVHLYTRQQGFNRSLVQMVPEGHWMKLPISY